MRRENDENGYQIVFTNRHEIPVRSADRTGMALSVLAVAVFIAARQPYAGIFCFALLVIKTFGIMKVRENNEYK